MIATAGAFDGIRVVEVGQFVAAPIAAELFAHGGADVIKIEPVTGDATRNVDPLPYIDRVDAAPSDAARSDAARSDAGRPVAVGRQYVIKARGKRALPVDLGSEAGREVVRRLATQSDVFISNMRPGNAARLGLDYDTLRSLNPRLIYGEINGFGDAGPLASEPSFDLIAQSWSGLRFATSIRNDGEFASYEPYFADYVAGLLLAFAVSTALFQRERTGEGQRVSTSLAHAALYVQHRSANLFETVDQWKRDLVEARTDGATFDELVAQREPHAAPEVFFMTSYRTRDGGVAIGAGPRLAGHLCEMFGLDDPRGGPEWSDRSRRDDLMERTREQLALKLRERSSAEVVAALQEVGIPASPVRMLEEVLVDPDAHAAGLVYDADHPRLGRYTMPSAPISMSGADYHARETFSDLGEHTDVILAEFGFDGTAIADLSQRGVVYRAARTPD